MRRFLALPLLVVLALFGCDNDPAEAVVVNELPDATIEKTWFRTTLFSDPLESGQTSRTLRVGVGREHAFAIVTIHGHTFLARTNDPVDAREAEEAKIVFSPATARSLCFGEPRMSADEQAQIAVRIFPGDELATDPANCDAP